MTVSRSGTLAIFALVAWTMSAASASRCAERDLSALYGQREYRTVIASGQELLLEHPGNPEISMYVGRSYFDLGDPAAAVPYLERAVVADTVGTWVGAWAYVYLGSARWILGDEVGAGKALSRARALSATSNATRAANAGLTLLGFDAVYSEWTRVLTKHFAFHLAPSLPQIELDRFVAARETALESICEFFGTRPLRTIGFFVWKNNEAARSAGLPDLGFARPEYAVIHVLPDQTPGHEIAHVVANWTTRTTYRVRVIDEGVAVYLDQTGHDQFARVAQALAATNQGPPALREVWENRARCPDQVLYPLGGAWIRDLVVHGGRKRLFSLLADQRYVHAHELYGDSLGIWIAEFEDHIGSELKQLR